MKPAIFVALLAIMTVTLFWTAALFAADCLEARTAVPVVDGL